MRILHISPYSPVPPIFGGALRVYHILRGLARYHEVTFVTFGNEKERNLLVKEFGKTVRQIHVVPHKSVPWKHRWFGVVSSLMNRRSFLSSFASGKQMQEMLDRLLLNDKYDFVLIEFPHMGLFKLAGNVKTILDEHNVEYNNLYKQYRSMKSLFRCLT